MKQVLENSIEDILGTPEFTENGFNEFADLVEDFQSNCGYSLQDARIAAENVFAEQANKQLTD